MMSSVCVCVGGGGSRCEPLPPLGEEGKERPRGQLRSPWKLSSEQLTALNLLLSKGGSSLGRA